MNVRKQLTWLMFFAVVWTLAALLYGNHSLQLDEGATLNAAWHLWNGQALYTTVKDFVAPGSAYSIYWIWSLVGEPSFVAAKSFAVVLWCLSTLALAAIVKKLGGRKVSVAIAVLLWLLLANYYPPINHNALSSYLAVFWLWLLMQCDHSSRWWAYGLLGLMTALVTAFLQTKGLALAVAAVLIIFTQTHSTWLARFKALLFFKIAYCSALVSALLFWPISALWENVVKLGFQSNYLGVNQSSWFAISLLIIVILYLLICAAILKRRDVFMLAIVQVGLAGSTANLVDYHHVLIIAYPTCILIGYQLGLWLQSTWPRRILPLTLRLATIIIVGSSYGIIVTTIIIGNFSVGNLWQSRLKDMARLNFPQVQAAQYIYAGPFLPNMYLEFGKPNPFVHTNNFTLCDPTCQAAMMQTFLEVKPEYVFLYYSVVEKYHYYPADDLIGEYVRAIYQECYYPVGQFQLYTRLDCPSLADLSLE